MNYGCTILCLWFRASLIYINNCPTRCNTKQSIYYSASSLYMFLVSTTPIIRSTQHCNYSLRCWSYFFCSYFPPTWPSLATLEGGSCTIWPVPEAVVLCTPDDGCGWHPKHVEWTFRIIDCFVLHLVGQLLIWMYAVYCLYHHLYVTSQIIQNSGDVLF